MPSLKMVRFLFSQIQIIYLVLKIMGMVNPNVRILLIQTLMFMLKKVLMFFVMFLKLMILLLSKRYLSIMLDTLA
ncbi:hypothetical protein BOQ06_16315 [Klebsiella pneumoniae]|nr:hypothetical protein BOQ06_16315 [Klebsiella pneumoniae]